MAAQTLTLFLTSAISAIVLVAPQPRLGIAVELLVLAAVSGAAINAWLFLLRVPGTIEAPGQVSDSRGPVTPGRPE